jgi:serine/threonine protein kinase/tetratricopeptide (TPR) repeat protein
MAADPRRVKELFAAARDLTDEQERRALLDRECAGDVELRRRLEELLHAHDRPQPALDRPLAAVTPAPPEDTGTPAAAPSDADRQAGTVLAGKYKLLEKVGEGGMGSVWMAQQQEPVKRRVAVKLIKAGADSRAVLARFEAERQALALMDHPNIAKVLDAGTTPDGQPFFVMELVKGVPITAFCDARKLTPRQRLELFVSVCQAVQHAHQKGVIHRDIKPSNVLVALYDDRPVPKVIDFGLAKATGPQLTEQTLVTGFGAIVGTPQYMSPEQATLNNLDIDTRSDIYSLGVLLYELLTGSPPFGRKELEKAGMLEVLRVIREEEPPKPSTKVSTAHALPSLAANRSTEPAKLKRLLRGEIDWIVMKALEKERSWRYETANGFALDIQRYLADEPVQAGPPGAGYRLRKFVKRHRGRVLAAALVLLALLAGTVGTALGLVRAEGALRDTEAAQRAAQQAAVAEKQANAQAQERLKLYEKGVKILTSVFHDLDPESEEKEGASLRVLLGRRLGEAVKQLEGEAVGAPVVVAQLQSRLGRSLMQLGHYKQAEGVLTKARRTLETSLGGEHPYTLATKHNLASLYRDQGKCAEAEALFKEVLAARTARLEAHHPDILATKNNLAVLYLDQGKGAEAEALLKEVLAARTARLGAHHPQTLTTENNLASAYQSQGKYPQAEALYKEALAGSAANLGADHPQTLTTKNGLAALYWRMKRLDRSIPLLEEVLEQLKKKRGAAHPYTLVVLANLGVNYRDAGRLDEGVRCLEDALAAIRRIPGLLPDKLAWVAGSLAEGYDRAKQYAKSEPLYREFLEQSRRRVGAAAPRTADRMAQLGLNLLAQRKYAEAEPLLHDCLAVREKKQPDDWVTFNAESMLGEALLGQKKYADAEPLLNDGYAGLKQRQNQIPGPFRQVRLAEALGRLLALYEATGNQQAAARWRKELEALKGAPKQP